MSVDPPARAAPPSRASLVFLLACGLSVLSSAALIFIAEPMVARQLLPSFGGSPATWNTAVVFYQLVLLAGYAYAHWSLRRLGLRRQMLVHVAILLLPLLFLPPIARAGLDVPPTRWPYPWLMLALASAVALPFFTLASNTALVQRWWAASTATAGRDPYRLYAISNAGSLIALLSYPLLIELTLGIQAQARAWSVGYLAFVLVTALVMVLAWRSLAPEPAAATAPQTQDAARTSPIDLGRRLRWLLLAAVPASLLLSTTLTLTMDIVSVPLLWVIPLALYLVTFIVAFAAPERLPRQAIAIMTAVAIGACLLLLMYHNLAQQSLWILVLVVMAPLVFGGLLCHLDLALDRPEPEHLTEFYLWVALGGFVGGVLNTIVAPILSNTIAEFPLTLAVLACLLPAAGPGAILADLRRALREPRAMHVAILVGTVLVAGWQLARGGEHQAWWLLVLAGALIYSVALARPATTFFALAVASIALIAALGHPQPYQVEAQTRSFFGVVQVLKTDWGRAMLHGTTIHGLQASDPAQSRTPTGYYYPTGPLSGTVAEVPADGRYGVVGLGIGAVAALSKPGQSVDFFEIDPAVVELAETYFTHLADAPADVSLIMGDGRLTLEQVADQTYDLLLIDAFTSDAIPVHLLTAEAIDLYRRKIKPTGLVLMHLSSQHLDLHRVAQGWVREHGIAAAVQRWQPDDAESLAGASPTLVVALGAEDATIERLIRGGGGYWQQVLVGDEAVYWTDDYSNVLGVFYR